MHRLLTLASVLLVVVVCCGKNGDIGTMLHFDGGWVSAGGELTKDSNNPWWLKNVAQVRYCVAVDESGISATATRLAAAITDAIDFWKSEYNRRPSFLSVPQGCCEAGVATQRFDRVPCDGTEDIRFQFGYGTLSESQRAYLREPRRFVGVTVRTAYDRVNLRGKGFVFIASDRGPQQFDSGMAPLENAWSHGEILSLVVAHELGHVFGLSHESGSQATLMASSFPEYVVSKLLGSVIQDAKLAQAGPIFVPRTEYHARPAGPAEAFFKEPLEHRRLRFVLDEKAMTIAITSFSEPSDGKAEKPIGRLEQLALVAQISTPLSLIFITPEQQLFKSIDPKQYAAFPYVVANFSVSGRGPASLVLTDGTRRATQLTVEPRRLQLLGELDGRIEMFAESTL